MSWDRQHPKSSLVIRLLLAVWIGGGVIVTCATGNWWGLVFIAPLVLDVYLLRRSLVADSYPPAAVTRPWSSSARLRWLSRTRSSP